MRKNSQNRPLDESASRVRRRRRRAGLTGLALAVPLLAFALLGVSGSGAQDEEDYPHGAFVQECALCHSDAGWKPARISRQFDHGAMSGFELSGAHGTVECVDCHRKLDFTATSDRCSDCHSDVHNGELGIDCGRCHTTETFIDRGDQMRLHRGTRFPLSGAHTTLDCERCHSAQPVDELVFVGTASECEACHLPDYQGTLAPNHQQSGFDTQCVLCHSTTSWRNARFDHSATGFPLKGAHGGLDCAECHAGGGPGGGGPVNCYSCHREDYDATTNPDHKSLGMPTDCERCHTGTSWRPADFDHNLTNFPLVGAHAPLDCQACHGDGVYTGKSSACYSCHAEDYNGTRQPDHRASGYSTDCTVCHNMSNWNDANFDHNQTQFPLTGAHKPLDCQACHADGVYSGKPTDCYSCHADDYAGTRQPDHSAAGYSTDCTVCHNTSNWNDANFDHNQTQFPLTGAHKPLDCQACHADGVYSGKPTDCYSCHADDYNGTQQPDHGAAGFSTDCTTCHSTSNWNDATFDHAQTNFPLTGAHKPLDCQACHADGVYSGKPTDCYSCHADDYNGTRQPDHRASGYSTDCTVCHNTSNWNDATFDHNQTNFPLTGAHKPLDCQACHADGVYSGKPTDCYSCHAGDYNGTRNPDHKAANFSTDCTSCHNTSGWAGATYDHNQTQFPLTGAHKPLDCQACHADGVYDGKPTDCYSCHAGDYNGTKNPDHRAAGFSTDCTACHNTSGWPGASYDHSGTNFPLTGSHRGLDCQACHADGVYAGKPTDCYSCHATDYNNTTNPNHMAAGFPTDCAQCHNTTRWGDANFDHDGLYFPIYSGKHKNKWDTCADCHFDPNDYSAFSCLDCHEHNKTKMDDKHKNKPGYRYDSNACYECHPRGKG